MEPDLKFALRDSKTATRPYVIVNPILAKHLPAVPSMALDYFMRLGSEVAAICKDERVLVIGFAETATAVGAAVASAINNAVYVHTTREERLAMESPDVLRLQDRLVAEFFEEHSHAKNQSLYLSECFGELSAYNRIVFVEDEITTGKTILNFLRSVDYRGKITVAALVFNGLDEGAFSQFNADFVCLQKIGYVNYLEFDGLPNPRCGTGICEYNEKCADLISRIISSVSEADIRGRNILVIGTEEFMYPALMLGRELEKSALSVKSQSTTRSPLLTQENSEYPFRSRCSFSSVYDRARVTYLYNLEKYDTVILITDAPEYDGTELIRAIQSCGNQIIYFIRVHNAY